MSTKYWKEAFCISATFLCELAFKILQISVVKSMANDNDAAINEILLYGAEDEQTRRQTGLDNLLCIYYLIMHASRSIDVCIPSLASGTLTNCFIYANQKDKVKIRIIIHSSDDLQNLQLLAQHGFEVKIINPAVRLEHEFILIDASEGFAEAMAVMGSLDYDTTRVNCNRDATLLTSEATVVRSLKSEFNRIWNSSDFTHLKNDERKMNTI